MAQLISLAWNGISGAIASLLYYVLLTPLTWLLAWAGKLVNYALQPWPLISSDFVQTGWVAMRDLSNMLFILVLLGIALDYILFGSFGVKKALPRLLLIALLVNFSLPIAGVALDFANVFTSFFIERSGGAEFTETMGARLGLATNIFNATNAGEATNAAMAADNIVLDVLFAIIFIAGTLFVFLALAALFLIRNLYLSVLLIVLPLVLTASILPFLSSHFKKWISKFFQWTMFAPAAAFFLYLAMVFLDSSQMKALNDAMGSTGGGGGFLEKTGTQITTYVFAWILMIMSLTVAQSMGITGASTATAMWSKGTKWARGKATGTMKGAAKTTAAAAGRAVEADKRMEKLASGLQKALPGWAGGGLMASGVRGVAAKTRGAMEKQEALTSAEKAKLEGLSNEALKQEMKVYEKSKLPGSDIKAAQIYETLMKRGEHVEKNPDGTPNTDATSKRAIEAYAIAKRHGNKDMMKNIRKANPDAWQTIAENEWKEEIGKENIVEDAKGNKRNRITGKTLEETKNRAFEEMTSADFENLKGTWRTETVKQFLASGSLSQSHLRMANNAGDGHFIKSVGDALEDKKVVRALKEKNRAFFNYLKSGGGHDYYGVSISESILKDMGEESGKEGGGQEKKDIGKEIDKARESYEG